MIFAIPLRPALRLSQVVVKSLPKGEMQPMPVMTTRRSFIVSGPTLATSPPGRKSHHGLFPSSRPLAEPPAAAFFIGRPAGRARHDAPVAGILEGMKAQPADDAVGQRAAFRPGVQRSGNQG